MGLPNRPGMCLNLSARLLTFFSLIVVAAPWAETGLARQNSGGGGSTISIVHGVAGAGPLDVYLDGAIALIGIAFGEVSGELAIEAGEHDFAVAPSGAGPDAAIAAGQISLEDGAWSHVALLGTASEASVGMYAIDGRPIDIGRARFRIISGVADAGEISPVFTGGDALSEPLGFGDASQYAAVDAGVYDIELLDAATGNILLSLPQTPLADGTATDVIVIGQLSDGTLQALVNSTVLVTESDGEWTAGIFSGGCGPDGPPVADLGMIRVGQGDTVGAAITRPVAQGYGLATVPFSALMGSPHVVAVIDTAGSGSGSPLPLACGEIGGPLTDTGALVIALQASHTEAPDGIAVLTPALENPETTGVSIFLSGFALEEAAGEPEAIVEEDAG